eukprot:CAMPEP_0204522178 /NCGR_PEP_ID=MMETSP0661-20131031/6180_1 /ASSEMBLY_ACC=CAM_ASM_000606 /TAXON_ID=109239 /ORGANISM="Alexandrium margalefi, Strain AMGDE01CS-322" /LENGTH=71 /DNA_ID=CAMNT_0051527821 /DNA_START=140 /DNA_END=351 /DNA_ORIENTATION=+
MPGVAWAVSLFRTMLERMQTESRPSDRASTPPCRCHPCSSLSAQPREAGARASRNYVHPRGWAQTFAGLSR